MVPRNASTLGSYEAPNDDLKPPKVYRCFRNDVELTSVNFFWGRERREPAHEDKLCPIEVECTFLDARGDCNKAHCPSEWCRRGISDSDCETNCVPRNICASRIFWLPLLVVRLPFPGAALCTERPRAFEDTARVIQPDRLPLSHLRGSVNDS